MIPLDKLRAITHVVTHANCPDGVASALIIKDALPDVRVSFMSYDSAEHKALEPAPGVLFVDFSPYLGEVVHEEGSTLWHWQQAGAIVLDHHPTRRDVVEAFGELGVFGENDKNECGAWLAYTQVWMPLRDAEVWNPEEGPADKGYNEIRRFAELAAIRDTWKKDDPRWQEACEQAAELVFWGYEHRSQAFTAGGVPGWAVRDERLGKHLMDKQLAAARKSLGEGCYFRTTKEGTAVAMFQGVSATSDAAEILEIEDRAVTIGKYISQVHLVVGFHYRMEGDNKLTLQFSMRSHTGEDVGAFAKHHGGGGHAAAAGFTIEVSPELSANPYQVFRLLLEEWEGRDG